MYAWADWHSRIRRDGHSSVTQHNITMNQFCIEFLLDSTALLADNQTELILFVWSYCAITYYLVLMYGKYFTNDPT